MNIYYISGLGADERAFSQLDFVKEYDAKYLPWLLPTHKKENIEVYAKRMAEKIVGDDIILVGLSFGGMVSMEIAKHIKIKQIILISSCKTAKELPPQIKVSGSLGLNNIVPNALIKKSKVIVHNFLGTFTPEEKTIANDFIDTIDNEYLSWSMRSISTWKNKEIACPVFHIHGTKDMLLQHHFLKADVIIEGGNHFMLYNKAQEVNKALNPFLKNI